MMGVLMQLTICVIHAVLSGGLGRLNRSGANFVKGKAYHPTTALTGRMIKRLDNGPTYNFIVLRTNFPLPAYARMFYLGKGKLFAELPSGERPKKWYDYLNAQVPPHAG